MGPEGSGEEAGTICFKYRPQRRVLLGGYEWRLLNGPDNLALAGYRHIEPEANAQVSKLVIFGAGKTAQVVHHYFKHDSPHEVVAFTCDADFIQDEQLFGLPVVPFESVENSHPPDDFEMFVAVGYEKLNQFRAYKYAEAKRIGYELICYVSSQSGIVGDREIGDNCLVMENACVQPHAKIGNDVFVWGGALIGHHCEIGDHCWITSHASIAGSTRIGSHCFIGINATIGHEVTVGAHSLVGAGTRVTKSVGEKTVLIAPDTEPYRLDSERFLALTGLM